MAGGGEDRTVRGGEDRTVRDVVSEVTSDLTALIREEMALAKLELRQGFTQLANGIAFLVVAAFILNAGLLALVASLVLGLAGAMEVWLSALVVGLVLAAVGAFLMMRGVGNVRNAELKPDRTLESLRDDAKILKERGHER